MFTRRFLTSAILANIILGNFCFMPMASAMDAMPADHDMPEMEQVTEMVMTPANAMSPLHCEGCLTIERPRHHVPDMGGGMPCNDGHCLSEHTPSTAVVTQSAQKDMMKVALRPVPLFLELPEIDHASFMPRAGPDYRPVLTKTVVLRE